MAPLAAATLAPSLSLAAADGGHYNIPGGSTLLLAFYESSCPVCELTLPLLARLSVALPTGCVLGVSQEDREETLALSARLRLCFAGLVDAPEYQASLAYRVTVVPTLYLVSRGRVAMVSEGFNREELAAIADRLVAAWGARGIDLFAGRDDLPAFRPG